MSFTSKDGPMAANRPSTMRPMGKSKPSMKVPGDGEVIAPVGAQHLSPRSAAHAAEDMAKAGIGGSAGAAHNGTESEYNFPGMVGAGGKK